MTRINTNVSSLNAQKTLARSNAQLQQALTRLSTGLRINAGKDDPAGLIASEMLRSDIVGAQKAITNNQTANQMIATADSALGQVSALLNDIRGLVEEAANRGALSDAQIAANQLQIDSSLQAIDRIAQVTRFQGRALLDGNLDFVTTNVDETKLTNLRVNQANFGTQTQIDVGVNVASQASQAVLVYNGSQISGAATVEIGGANGFQTFNFGAGSTIQQIASAINLVSDATGVQAVLNNRVAETASQGESKLVNIGGAEGLKITADTAGKNAGDFTVRYTTGSSTTAAWTAGSPNVIDVTVETSQWAAAGAAAAPVNIGGNNTLTLAAKIAGSQFNGVDLEIVDGGANTATYDYATNKVTVNLTVAGSTASDVATLINNKLGNLFTATAGGAQDNDIAEGTYNNLSNNAGTDGGTVQATLADVRAAINGTIGSQVTATDLGSNSATTTVDVIKYSGAIGELNNAAGAGQPNNRIQLTGTDSAAHMPVVFRSNGVNQSLSISFINNTRTNGKSTAYLQGAGGGSVLKIEAVAQGSQNDGWTFNIVNSASEKSIVYDKATKTVTYTNALAGKTANAIASELNAVVGSQFQVTVISGGTNNFTTGASAVTADGSVYDGVYVNLATDANGVVTSTANEVVAAINANSALQSLGIVASNVTYSDGSGVAATGTVTLMEVGKTASNQAASGATFAANGATARLTVTAKTAGAAYNGVKIAFVDGATSGSEYATYDATNKILTFHIADGVTTADQLVTAFNTGSGTAQAVKDLFTVTGPSGGGGGAVTATDIGWLSGGVTYTGTSLGGVDSEGNYDAGQVIGTAGLSIKSIEYGSKQFVSVKTLSGTFTTYDSTNTASQRANGTDARVQVNGIQAVADGLKVALSTSTLDLSFDLLSTVTAGTNFTFQLVGGGALFQIGPDVLSSQQARLGIGSVNSSRLGGTAGRLDELKSGGAKSLTGDIVGAGKVVNQAIATVATLRGRLGAFQKTTLDTNIATLNDTLQALTDAESSIRDADFAAETANLTRAQILAQSGLSVLKLANQSPQQVLTLLQ